MGTKSEHGVTSFDLGRWQTRQRKQGAGQMATRQQATGAPGPTRVAIYCRVSTTGQEDNSSLETQEALCRAYAAERGWAVVTVYREVHTGAELFERPQLSMLREAVRLRTVDVVVSIAIDRLTREQDHLGFLVSEIEYAGACVEIVTEPFEHTPEGKLVQSAKAFSAAIERLKFMERSQRGRRARVERGCLIAGCRPLYGYRWIDEIDDATREIIRRKARLEFDPETGRVVTRIFRDIFAGHSLRSITLALTTEGIPTPTGKDRWSASTINWILTNPTYTGTVAAIATASRNCPVGSAACIGVRSQNRSRCQP